MTLPRRQDADSPRSESTAERVDRNLTELLNELRVALPGVQVLFAFLLTVPFASGFDRMNEVERSGYFGTFLLTAGATACLMAPAAYHRARFRRDDKERLLRTANRFTVAGTALLMLAITGASFVVTDMLYHGGPAVVVGLAVLLGTFWCWFGDALLTSMRSRSRQV